MLLGGSYEQRGLVPRFIFVKGPPTLNDSTPADADLSLADLFERIVAAVPLDPAFAPVEIVSHGSRRIGPVTELEIMIDRDGGVDIDLSERISRHLNARFADRTDLYTLLVASAGLERPLVKPGDYERFREKNVRILTTLAVENRKTHRGRLLGVRGDAVVIDLDRSGRELPLPLDLIKSANLEYDPRADLTRDKRERKHGDKNR